jgi:hypothetical protein
MILHKTGKETVGNEGKGYEMFDIWEVVEELVTLADEQGTGTISMFQIGKELKDAGENSAHNVQEVRKALVELGYRVGM